MAIDKSIRQYYQDGEKVKKLKLVEMGEELTGQDKLVSKQKRKSSEEWKGLASEFILNKHRITSQDIKDVKEGTSSIPKVVKRILKRYVGMGEQEKAQGLNLSDNKITSVLRAAKTGKGALDFFSGSQSLLKFFAPAAVVGGVAYLHKNRERFTGYPTQVAYEQAQQGRIDASRAQMRLAPKTKQNLKINWERQGFNDDEIREKERKYDEETAELLGATVIDDQIILGQDYFPDLGGDPEGQAEASPTVSETAATEDININQAPVVTPLPVFQPPQRAPTPVHHWTPSGNGGGGQNGGGGYRGDPGGGAAGSPFKKGGRIDKPLTGRSRDI